MGEFPLRQCNISMAALTHLNEFTYVLEFLLFPLVRLRVPVVLSTAVKGICNEEARFGKAFLLDGVHLVQDLRCETLELSSDPAGLHQATFLLFIVIGANIRLVKPMRVVVIADLAIT